MRKLKYFRNDDYLLVYNIETLQLLKFRSDLKNILPSLLPEAYSEKQKDLFLKQTERISDPNFRFFLYQLFETNDLKGRGMDIEKETISITFAPTHDCNLRCKYCFAESGRNYRGINKNMDVTTLKHVLKFIFDVYAPECRNMQISLVSGGEPFLNLGICEDLIKFINDYYKSINIKLFVATNGTIYNDEIKNYLLELNPQLGISIDGDKAHHDKNRLYSNAQGTYDYVVNTIEKIQSDNDLSNKTRDFILMTVLTPDNLDIVNILKHHNSLGASSAQIKLVRSNDERFSLNEDNLILFKKAYSYLHSFLLDEYSSGNIDYLLMITNNADYFGKFVKSLILSQPNTYRCGAGKDRFSFSANGDIYPCDNFVGINDYLLGNVYDQFDFNTTKRFYKLDVNELNACKSCWVRYLCTGDCCYHSLIRTGDMYTPDETMCEFFTFLAELAIKLVAQMDDIDRQQYKRFKRIVEIREANNFIH